MRAIFISYRRDDAEGEAGRLFDDLVGVFGEKSVFMEVAAIEVGRDFRKAIDESVATCGVLLALIGKDWIDAKNEAGQRRLDNPSDFVRLETASALKRDIPVVPVLVRGARMPQPEQLPDDLKELAYRNGVELTHARWNSDLQLLIKALQPHVEDSKTVVANANAAPAPPGKPAAEVADETKTPQIATGASAAPRKKPLAAILALVAAAVIAIIVVASMMMPKEVGVPDLSGNTLSEATAKLEALHLTLGQKTSREAPTKEPNTVLSQSPSPDTRVKTGSRVDLVLSASPLIEVPAVAGMSLDDALRTLSDRQLQVGSIDREPKAGMGRDTVFREFPAAGERIASGSKVDLMVSDVPENASTETGRSEPKVSRSASTQSETAPISNSVTTAASQSRATPDATGTSAYGATRSNQVVSISGVWHDSSGVTYQVSQNGNNFTYTATALAGMSRGTGLIKGLEFVSSYNTVLINGARSTGRCAGTISADGRTLQANCYDSAIGQSVEILVR